LLKALASAGIAVAAVLAIDRWCYLPLACDVTEKRIIKETTILFDNRNWTTGMRARKNLSELRNCIDATPGKVSLYMTAAANCRLIGAPDEGVALCEAALRYDRRPEIYAYLAVCQLQLNRRDDAIGNFVTAGMFSPMYITNIDDADVRTRVDEIVSKQRMLPWHVSQEQ